LISEATLIAAEHYAQALRAVHRLIVHAKSQAHDAGADRVAELLNDIELLPEFIADETDRTGEFAEMLQGIAQVHPNCQYIVEEFERVSTGSA
jgi:hypothetical protein